MPQVTLQQALDLAHQHLRAGRMGEAESVCRQVLAFEPNEINSLLLLARLAFESGRLDEAEEMMRRALAGDPNNPNHHNNFGSILAARGKLEEAATHVRRALALSPNAPEIHGNLGNVLQSSGATDQAIEAYRHALSLKPDSAEVHNNLANSLRNKGDLDGAIGHFRHSLSLRPGFADTQLNLARALAEKGQWDEAIAACEDAIRMRPQHADTRVNLGNTMLDAGRVEEAITNYRRAIELRPDLPEAHYGLGCALRQHGDLNEAIASFNRAIQLRPNFVDAWNNLGITHQEKGEFEPAVTALSRAIEIHPSDVKAHNNLGIVYHDSGRLGEAVGQYRKAIEIDPKFADALANLALTVSDMGQIEEAIGYFRQALAIRPDQSVAMNNFANALKEAGRMDEAIEMYHRAAQTMKQPWAASNFLFAMYALPRYGPEEILEEHVRWARRYADPLKPKQLVFDNDPSPDRRIRIGYVSPDFNEHPVGRFLLPLLSNHDHQSFEIFCYSDVHIPDGATQELMNCSDVWRKTNGMTDQRVAEMIRQDHIDILVDLAAHAKDNRLLVFAHKPAPVQVTYLAYCGTTGLDTIDYRLTDPYLDPLEKGDTAAYSAGHRAGIRVSPMNGPLPLQLIEGVDETGKLSSSVPLYSERSVWLPGTYWCYSAPRYAPAVGRLPARSSGYITFGCLNSFTKVSTVPLEMWCELLNRVSGSRLLLHAREGSHRNHVREQLSAQGIDPRMLEFVPRTGPEQYFQQYNRIDIGLDPFPYPGGTTTCDALWMGVPVVSVIGKTAVSRGGYSILSNVGLEELVAADPEQYVQIAADLASDIERLSQLRAGLRARMQASLLMDAPRFAKDVEAAFGEMWRGWCRNKSPSAG